MAVAQFIDSALQTSIVNHILEAVESHPLLEDPYPHFQIEGFFPNQVYQDLQSFLPNEGDYEEFSYEKTLGCER